MAPDPRERALTPEPELDRAAWIASIRSESQALAQAAAKAGFDAPVPTCPEWQVRDLVRHLGGVHRWAAAHVAGGRAEEMPKEEAAGLMASYPADRYLLEWFELGQRNLCQVLGDAPADLQCWSFLPSPSPLAFWARRQAHETEIHRADAEFAARSGAVSFPEAIAADGIEEMLFGFAAGRRHLKLPAPLQIALRPREQPDGWLVQLGPDGILAERGQADADCRISGTCSQIFLWLWNRLPSTSLEVDGNRESLESWRRAMRVSWS
ncbi:MAG: maleylpyruvate isomerase family mycothiol-dependent enzyme [Candidatus Dormiibacterota bacterium]